MAIVEALPHSLAESRFTDVVAGHWPVFAILAAMLVAVGVVGLLLRRRARDAPTAGSERSPAGGTAQVVGWATVVVVPPMIYVAMLAADFSVQSSIFAAMLAATVLFWMFGLVEEFVPGGDLTKRIAAVGGPLPEAEALRHLRGLASTEIVFQAPEIRTQPPIFSGLPCLKRILSETYQPFSLKYRVFSLFTPLFN
jgi:hypothetical protein